MPRLKTEIVSSLVNVLLTFIPQRWKFVEVFSLRGRINWWFAHHFRHCFILHRLCQPQSRHHVCPYIWLIYSQFVCSERANASSARLSPYFYLYNSTSNVRYFSAILISPLHCGHPFRGASLKPELWKHIYHEAVKSLFAVVLTRMLCLLKGLLHTCSTILNSHTFRNCIIDYYLLRHTIYFC